jgi:hypothetical protein
MNDVKDALINDPIYSKYIDFSGLSNIKNGQTLGESRGKVYFFAYDEKQGIENPTEFNQ